VPFLYPIKATDTSLLVISFTILDFPNATFSKSTIKIECNYLPIPVDFKSASLYLAT